MLILITIQHLNRIIKCTHELKFASWNFLQTPTKTISQFLVSQWREPQSPLEPVRPKQYTEFEVFGSCSRANSTRGKPLRKYETKKRKLYTICFQNFTTVSERFGTFSTNVLFPNFVSSCSIFNMNVTHISVEPEH